MHNTIPLTIMMLLTTVTASAQFYTITRDTEISVTKDNKVMESIEIKANNSLAEDSILQIGINPRHEENQPQNVPDARKSDDYKSPNENESKTQSRDGKEHKKTEHSTTPLTDDDLPELTIPNLLAEIKKNNIKYPKIVLAQAILETGWFKSSVCRNKHNLFGLTNPRTKTYYEFNHWTESVSAYKSKVQYKYKGGNYLLWLDKIGYAEDKTYVRAVIRVLKTLDNR